MTRRPAVRAELARWPGGVREKVGLLAIWPLRPPDPRTAADDTPDGYRSTPPGRTRPRRPTPEVPVHGPAPQAPPAGAPARAVLPRVAPPPPGRRGGRGRRPPAPARRRAGLRAVGEQQGREVGGRR